MDSLFKIVTVRNFVKDVDCITDDVILGLKCRIVAPLQYSDFIYHLSNLIDVYDLKYCSSIHVNYILDPDNDVIIIGYYFKEV